MPYVVKKLLASFFVFLILFSSISFVFTPKTKATGEWYDQSFTDWNAKVFSGNQTEIFGERYTRAQVQWIIYSLASFLINGVNPDAGKIIACISTKSPADCTDVVKSVLDSMGDVNTQSNLANTQSQTLLGAIFEKRPISAVSYIEDIVRNFKVVPEVEAQTGFGFIALNPVLELWKASRNITYSLFVLIIIIMSFMIMFRVKLSPQTVISVQSALPKMIVAIILITFSYAIAGFLIDLMYIFIGIISVVLSQASQSGVIQPRTSFQFFELITKGPATVLGANSGIFGFIIKYWIGALMVMGLIFFGADSIFIKLGAVLGFIAMFLFILILLWNWVKIFWMLLKTTAGVLLQTIIAPFQILLGTVIPNFGFGTWIRGYVANLAVYPVTGLLFVVSSIFLTYSLAAALGGIDVWGILGFLGIGVVPRDIFNFITQNEAGTNSWPPLLNVGDQDTTLALIYFGVSFVIITIIPKTVEVIQAIIKGGQFNYGSAIGESLSIVTTPVAAHIEGAVTKEEKTNPNYSPGVTTAFRLLAGAIKNAGK